MIRRNMRREFLTAQEVFALLREHGVDDVHVVRAAYLESDGSFSVLRRDRESSSSAAPRSGKRR
jgi:uncharacterized membrane protein YcaP (DUF421 family)